MGEITRVLITGAAGFIGRSTVTEAREAGLAVVALVRRAAPQDWAADPGIEVLRCDLADPDGVATLRTALSGVDTVIHAAAHLGGDADAHAVDTLTGTRTILDAMTGSDARRLVLVSSIAVYDTMTLRPGAILTEACPLEPENAARDPYVAGKLAQERLCREAAARDGFGLWLMRPGAVFGPDRLWNAHLGVGLGPVLLRVGDTGEVPLCHIRRCGWALVKAAMTDPGGIRALNVLDDDLPDRDRFLTAMRRSGWPRFVVPLHWKLLNSIARALRRRSAHLPGLLREPVLRARIMPLRYCNRAMRKALGGRQARTFEVLMAASIAGGSR
ncbi:NAD(P)-dependent oxidoreductase [Puniceibacterium sp. IMCC21224]|uniref:NAD-dependent epimerase/dehydratase family protein n=1 Tax=Puniceibacterium sp. IMCC21224 TaxID=1618204 RepID=UPI00064DBC79|nr:NAD(P)-dependent oxidoreductase [Puniceibacterium sp. IMCC21224]KMK65650.1 nucleoside-diphosphate-sugar epimerase [Puniceibacterium sp. IMCC21224]